MKLILTTILTLLTSVLVAQITKAGDEHMPLKFIDKVEVFAGPSQSFNYGNKFVENYKDENIENKRELKVGYIVGIGLCHGLSPRLSLNFRFQYEQKGRKTELNTPWSPTSRLITTKDYTYNYLTALLTTQIGFGVRNRWKTSFGLYYSKINNMQRYERTTFDNQTLEGRTKGRSFENIDDNGGINTGTWIPGLRSFEFNDFGTIVAIGYYFNLNEKQILSISVIDNLGLKNINKDNPYNFREKNHSLSLLIGYTLLRPIKKTNY